ncbi:MAG: hypothetical protein ACXVJD_04710 [Mucilaginibacter sp.]
MEKSIETPQTEKKTWITPDLELISRDDIQSKNYISWPEGFVFYPGMTGSGPNS